MEKIDIILQGQFSQYTLDIANRYLDNLEFIDKIIISCWKSCPFILNINKNIFIVRNEDINNPGITNRNRQIVSSLNGLKLTNSQWVMKSRSDIEISIEGMIKWYNFIQENKYPLLSFENNNLLPINQMFVSGNFLQYPFHPRDHIFIGHKNDLNNVFNIPLDNNFPIYNGEDYNNFIRSEVYIGAHYCKNFNKDISNFIENPKLYLTDNATQKTVALNLSKNILDKIFKPLPRVAFNMPKYNRFGFYHYSNSCGEYWAD